MRWWLLLCVLALAGCGREAPPSSPFRAPQADATDYATDFSLFDSGGKPRSLASYRGKLVVLFFGYTHCPDVCPTTLGDMATVLRQLGPRAQQVQVLFVTLDPARDTPQMLAQYVPAFHPSFAGLTADEARIAATARAFRVVYRKNAGAGSSYTLDHSAGSFVFDKTGHLRLLLPYGQSPGDITHDLELLLNDA